MVAPKFAVYSWFECRSDREELRPIDGQTVTIIDRMQSPSGEWQYKVYGAPEQPNAFFVCFESELRPSRKNIAFQSANLRHSVKYEGLRELLRQRGYDPMRCVQVTCEQGDDVYMELVLSDDAVVGIDFRECSRTRQAASISRWIVMHAADEDIEVRFFDDHEYKLARELVTLEPQASQLDVEIRAYFDNHFAATDAPWPIAAVAEW